MDAILTFHSVDPGGSILSYDPGEFRRLLEGLGEEGVQFVTLDALYAPAQRHRVALTFDDGLRSVHRNALPVLAEWKIPALVYVVSGRVGQSNAWPGQPSSIETFELMGWTELEECRDAGIEVGAHTHQHVALSGLEEARWDEELRGCRALLEERLGTRVRHFAYPYGTHDAEAVRRVAEVYDTAVTTRLAYLAPGLPRHRWPRLDTYYLRQPRRALPLFGARTRAYLGMRAWLRRMKALGSGA